MNSHETLRTAAFALRAAQRAYMADRGNAALGREVAIKAAELDLALEMPSPMSAGVLFRWGSLWLGAHYSPHHRRWCINLIPCVTLWFTLPGGTPP